ncbi:MAG: type I pullulanase [Muribaculaceae bacterium]|nr:type I pullulanase [Muribaculaceae bacterium]
MSITFKKSLISAGIAIFAATTFSFNTMAKESSSTNVTNNYDSYPVNNNFDNEIVVNNDKTNFFLWSPMAQEAVVLVYENYDSESPVETLNMTKNEANGTWSATINLEKNKMLGKYYTFKIKFDNKWLEETPGIWAKAVSINGKRAAIIDFDKTNPKGWENDNSPALKNQADAIIYEMHHRDFSMHSNSGINNKGKFIAMIEKGTLSLNGEKTGIDHLKELGITHVHILPSYDYNSIDEKHLEKNKYNWGYDPQNYNTPEGSYSTNPADPYSRISEMKQMVMALHKAGIGVVMDVVYNHTAIGDGSNFSLTAPGYFYRHRQDGTYSDASGCGNETASDREMMRQYIINSVKYWTKEYHIDGFRFDLMAIHDIETMNQVATELRKINPDAILYGEGWTAGDSPLPIAKRALKDNAKQMPGVAVFSDDIRDAIKGHYSNVKERGFATGRTGDKETVKFGIVGATNHPQIDFSKCNNSKAAYTLSPLQVVNYVSCHDDPTLTDKLKLSMPESAENERLQAAKLAQTIVFTSQGMPFMFAGEEVFRDKKGVHNSFESPDSINAINWNNKKTYRDQFDYYKNLIALRKAHPAFRMTTAEDVAKHLVFDVIDSESIISYSLIDNANGDTAKEIKVIFNGSDKPMKVNIPSAKWNIIVSDGKIDLNGTKKSKGGKITIEPRSAKILTR